MTRQLWKRFRTSPRSTWLIVVASIAGVNAGMQLTFYATAPRMLAWLIPAFAVTVVIMGFMLVLATAQRSPAVSEFKILAYGEGIMLSPLVATGFITYGLFALADKPTVTEVAWFLPAVAATALTVWIKPKFDRAFRPVGSS